jgi:transketolase
MPGHVSYSQTLELSSRISQTSAHSNTKGTLIMNETGHRGIDSQIVSHARVLPLDIVQDNGSGHAGTAVSLTPLMHILFQEVLRHDPGDPRWVARDRFVLSAGHASLALYLQLYLTGYGLEIEDLRRARSFGSRTPGHPERGNTPGVETTTGPLGQGVANAVGMAMAAARLPALVAGVGYSTEPPPLDSRIWCLASDGDLQEGVSHEASALASHLRLDNLVLIWDDNEISISGPTSLATSEDVMARYAAYGWRTLTIENAEDLGEIRKVLLQATHADGRPTFVRLCSTIGHPMPTKSGTSAAHSGAPGPDEVKATKAALGLETKQSFHMPAHLLEHARAARVRGRRMREEWESAFRVWQDSNPRGAELLARILAEDLPGSWRENLPVFEPSHLPVPTRQASQLVLAAVSEVMPELWGGSADLAESNGAVIPNGCAFGPENRAGQQIHFGIREHAMGGVLNGMALFGGSRPFGATFLSFADYMRPSVRLAAMMGLRVIFIWSHDSISVGEDGPTHQPVEHLWAYRAVPGLSIVRPADANETVAAWTRVLERKEGPVAFCLSRHALPMIPLDRRAVAEGTQRGAYILRDSSPSPDVILIATGAEVHMALEAAAVLGQDSISARVVSVPCLEWFEAESPDYQESVLPTDVRARVSVEAGTATGWHRWIGSFGRTVSVEKFGASGSGDRLLHEFGISVQAIVQAARGSLHESHAAGAARGTRQPQ